MHFMHFVYVVASLRTSVKIICLLSMVLGVLYILTLSHALKKCSVPSRTMRPGLVWLMLIPLFNIIWQFFVVVGLGKSLGNESQARRIPNAQRRPGMPTGIAMCVCAALTVMPIFLWSAWVAMPQVQAANESGESIGTFVVFVLLLGLFALSAAPYLVLWIIYWTKIARCSRMLGQTPAVSAPQNSAFTA